MASEQHSDDDLCGHDRRKGLRMRFVLAFLSAVLLTSCAALATKAHGGRDTVLTGMTLDEVRLESGRLEVADHRRPVVAIALGGGGMRGYAHIGVLQGLEEIGIQPDIVVGTSIGAIVGASYAAGATPAQLWQRAENTNVFSLADITLGGPGLLKGEALANWTDSLVDNVPIERFPKRFAAVASDLDRSVPVVLTTGDAGQAIRASAAVPGVFLPVRYQGGELVDGGVMSVVPIRTARAMGADIVIGVDIYCHGPRYQSKSIWTTLLRVAQAQTCLISQNELAEADVLITPAVSPVGANDADGRERARQAGYDAAKSAAPQLKAVLALRPPNG
jgi:NTE family protein